MSTRTRQFAIRFVLATVVAGLIAGCSVLGPRIPDAAEYAVTIEAVSRLPVVTIASYQWPTSTPTPIWTPTATPTPTATAVAHFLPMVAAEKPTVTPIAIAVEVARSSDPEMCKPEAPETFPLVAEAPIAVFTESRAQPLLPVPLVACDCSADLYNCPIFNAIGDAQACFDSCRAQGYGDIHDLDGDDDGIACEAP